jgi:sec-independent protein translocase protein TatC
VEDEKLPITSHLEELRSRLIKCVLAVLLGVMFSYAFSQQIFGFLAAPMMHAMPKGSKFIFTSPAEAFFTFMKVAFFMGLLVTSPVIFYQIWKFVMPALYDKERKYVIPFVLIATFFFLSGAAFGFFVVLPVGFSFFVSFTSTNIQVMPKMDEYLGFVMKFLLGFGAAFELPVFMFFLAKMGIVNAPMLRKNRKYAVLIVAIVAAILTPGPDVASQCMLGVPLYILYELSIWVAALVYKKKAEAKEALEQEDEPTEPSV